MFGLEIRKTGNIKNIFRDVDIILNRNNIERGEVTEALKRQALSHAFHKMFRPDQWLDICNIKECSKLFGVFISAERLSIYSMNHCVRWNEMLPDFRETLIAMILDDFREVFDKDTIIETTAIVNEEEEI